MVVRDELRLKLRIVSGGVPGAARPQEGEDDQHSGDQAVARSRHRPLQYVPESRVSHLPAALRVAEVKDRFRASALRGNATERERSAGRQRKLQIVESSVEVAPARLFIDQNGLELLPLGAKIARAPALLLD